MQNISDQSYDVKRCKECGVKLESVEDVQIDIITDDGKFCSIPCAEGFQKHKAN